MILTAAEAKQISELGKVGEALLQASHGIQEVLKRGCVATTVNVSKLSTQQQAELTDKLTGLGYSVELKTYTYSKRSDVTYCRIWWSDTRPNFEDASDRKWG